MSEEERREKYKNRSLPEVFSKEDLALMEEISVVPDLEDVTNFVTSSLTDAFINIGNPPSPHIDIYQKAIMSLYSTLLTVPGMDYGEGDQAFEELYSISEILGRLFSGQIKLVKAPVSSAVVRDVRYEGYTELTNTLRPGTKRIVIDQTLSDTYSQASKRISHANTEITIKDIQGKTSRGRAIAGSDSDIRCGLRHAHANKGESFAWAVSIDSGATSPDDDRWRIIRPLSQAIFKAKSWPSSGLNFEDSEYTFHYPDPATMTAPRPNSQEKNAFLREFFQFVGGLNRIFESLT